MFKISQGKGFHITYANGYSVSVQWGFGNYCDYHHLCADGDFVALQHKCGKDGSATAEIAGFNPDNEWCHPDEWDDDVKGYCTPAEVLEFMNWIASQ